MRKGEIIVTSPLCSLCEGNYSDNIVTHSFTCQFNNNAFMWLMDQIKLVDPRSNTHKIILLDFEADNDITEMASTWIIVETLQFVWARRKQKRHPVLPEMVSTLRTKAEFIGSSTSFKNASKFILNMIK